MNEYRFGVKGQERKALAGAISELLNQPTKYLGAPTFAYEIGGYHIDNEGTVTGEYDLNLFVGLAERGFESEPSKTFHLITPRGTLLCQERFNTAAEAEAAGYGIYFHHEGRDVYIKPAPDGKTEHSKWFAVVGAPFDEPEALPNESPAEPEPATDNVCIEYPLDGFTPETLGNLEKLAASKAPLIKKALGTEELPIRVSEDRVCFDWFRLSEDNGAVDAYAQFIACLCETAKEKKRVTAKAPDSFENEKFAMRVWLIGLGMVGKEYALARKLLLKNLDGNSSWRYGAPEKAAPVEDDVAPVIAETDIPEEVPAEATASAQGEEGEVPDDE